MDTTATPISEAQTTGSSKITEQVIEQTFLNELQLMQVIIGIVNASSMSLAARKNLQAVRKTQLDVVVTASRGPHPFRLFKLTGQKRENAIINICENYFLILDVLLREDLNTLYYVMDLMKKCWTAVRSDSPLDDDDFRSTAEEALYLLYKYAFNGKIIFSRFHFQATAHFALIEHRLRSGWLVGKYNQQWTKEQTDSQCVHKWVNRQTKVLNAQACSFEIPRIHDEVTGKKPNGM